VKILGNFDKIKEALVYIDEHLDESMSLESIAKHFHFSTFYFHRMFSLIVGNTLSVHVRDRRIMNACTQLINSSVSIISIGIDCGYSSAQAFSRSFKSVCGLSPSEYRKQGIPPNLVTVDEMIMKFTNR